MPEFFETTLTEIFTKRHASSFGGPSTVADDIFILASTDGFSPYINSSYDL